MTILSGFHVTLMASYKIISAILAVLILFSIFPQVKSSYIELEANANGVKAMYHLLLRQNFTLFKFEGVPISHDDAERISGVLAEGIKGRSPEAAFSDMDVELSAAGEILNLTFSFQVLNIAKNKGNSVLVDCSWKSFHVKDDLV
ncbi:MAG: hypothetical protein QXF26_03255, partial [Candidatus Bathyarchaeia archaeon]